MAQSIIVGVDGSETAVRAAEWAAAEASRRNWRVELIAACDPYGADAVYAHAQDAVRALAEADLRQAAQGIRGEYPEVELGLSTVEGSPAPELLRRAASASMVAVGLRGRGGFAALRIGSVAYQVAVHAPVPAAVVGPEPLRPDDADIVVGMDGSEPARHAAAVAFDYARLTGSTVRAVRVWPAPWAETPERRSSLDEAAVLGSESRRLERDIAPLAERAEDVAYLTEAVEGHPVACLLEAGTEARLLVIGARGRQGFTHLALGGTAHGLLHHARVPIMVVHSA
ncbi:universal stress protein [Nocardiopsis sediminis]|uniref:Universal stress protein n=1 Tax=Nocardiopsis sediminis TaxID=1778267 RepID=A0ABV8FQL6_9ACTN